MLFGWTHMGELIGCGHSVEMKMPELCSFIRKVLPDVDVLRSFSATNHIVGPLVVALDTRSVVFIHRRWRFGLESHIS